MKLDEIIFASLKEVCTAQDPLSSSAEFSLEASHTGVSRISWSARLSYSNAVYVSLLSQCYNGITISITSGSVIWNKSFIVEDMYFCSIFWFSTVVSAFK